MVKTKRNVDGFILLHPLHFSYHRAFFRSLDVTVYDKKMNLIARVKIKNGNRRATVLGVERFAKFCAKKIANLINSKRY